MLKKCRVFILFLLIICISVYDNTIVSLARDDNPVDCHLSQFPTAEEAFTNEYQMNENKGIIDRAISPGVINTNSGTIDTLEGALVDVNGLYEKDDSMGYAKGYIKKASGGTINTNNGVIDEARGQVTIKLNSLKGVIGSNYVDIEQNNGKIVNHRLGCIDSNYGNIDNISSTASVDKYYEGIIKDNEGEVTICPLNIFTIAKIENNKGKVNIVADPSNKSFVQIDNNSGNLIIGENADCTVVNNTGKIEVCKGGKCTVSGYSSEVIEGEGEIVFPEGGDYELVLDNIEPSDFRILENYKINDGKIYVSNEKNSFFKFTCDDSKYRVCWNDYGASEHRISIADLRLINQKYVDDKNKKVVLHFHTYDKYEADLEYEGYHNVVCNSCNESFKWEACSGGVSTCTSKAICEKCGNEYGGLKEHNWNTEYTIDIEPTVTCEGSKSIHCSVCGKIKAGSEIVIPKIEEPTNEPTASPTQSPSLPPVKTQEPTASPTQSPSLPPVKTQEPTASPTQSPSLPPVNTNEPTASPTQSPSLPPVKTNEPTASPTQSPSLPPVKTNEPTASPTQSPSLPPAKTQEPTNFPVLSPTPDVSATPIHTQPPAIVPARPTKRPIKLGKVKILSAKNNKKGTIKIKIKSLKNAKKYKLEYALNKKFRKAKKVTFKKLKKELKRLKKKTYYIRIRGVNGKKLGPWSKVKKVKVKNF